MAGGPRIDSEVYSQEISPRHAAEIIDSSRGSQVLWGGLLIGSVDTESGTQLEIIAYPLRSNQAPDTDYSPIGRFLVMVPSDEAGVIYYEGRGITVAGTLTTVEEGNVGNAPYRYPVVEAHNIFQWTPNRGYGSNVHFGFGFIFSN